MCFVLAWGFSAPAYAGPGYVISSFEARPGYRMFVQGIYRDASYVYAAVGDYTNNRITYLFKYTPSGSSVGLARGLPGPYLLYGDADHSALGDGYFAIIYDESSVRDIDLASGSIVSSWSPFADMYGYAYIPGGAYKYVLTEGGTVYRFTVAGSLVSSFAVGWGKSLAASDRFAGRSGEFVIVAGDRAANVYSGAGSLIRTFVVPEAPYLCLKHDTAACGVGYPGECNTTFWAHLTDRMPPWDRDFVYQISLGNGVAVAPASVGRIKALYR